MPSIVVQNTQLTLDTIRTGKLNNLDSIRTSAEQNEEIALALYEKPEWFEQVVDSSKVRIALKQPKLVERMLADDYLERLDSDALSYFVACYMVKTEYGYNNSITKEQRDAMALVLVQRSALVSKLYPAARFMLFARVQQLPEVNSLPLTLQNEVKQSYSLPVDGHLLFWLLSIVGVGSADYWGRFSDVYRTAVGEYSLRQQIVQEPQSKEDATQAEALAMAVIQDRRFIEGLAHPSSDYRYCKLTTNQRIELGKKYPQVALELLASEASQGEIPFTQTQQQEIISAHPSLFNTNCKNKTDNGSSSAQIIRLLGEQEQLIRAKHENVNRMERAGCTNETDDNPSSDQTISLSDKQEQSILATEKKACNDANAVKKTDTLRQKFFSYLSTFAFWYTSEPPKNLPVSEKADESVLTPK